MSPPFLEPPTHSLLAEIALLSAHGPRHLAPACFILKVKGKSQARWYKPALPVFGSLGPLPSTPKKSEASGRPFRQKQAWAASCPHMPPAGESTGS